VTRFKTKGIVVPIFLDTHCTVLQQSDKICLSRAIPVRDCEGQLGCDRREMLIPHRLANWLIDRGKVSLLETE
jgi:hypothetical protein